MKLRLFVAMGLTALGYGAAPVIMPDNRLDPAAPEWRELAARVSRAGDVIGEFEERRVFPFRAEPVVLRGEVRVSPTRGLSLHYTAPEERTIIIDAQGMLVRETGGRTAAPLDPRANAANEAMRLILGLDLARLAQGHELHGRQEGANWWLGLAPRDAGTRRAIGDILVDGEGDFVRRIELRRSPKQFIEIAIPSPRSVTFGADEVKKYFR